MMMYVFTCFLVLCAFTHVSHGNGWQKDTASPPARESLRLNSLQETTNWDLLEDLFLYHNAIRFFHNSHSIQFNRTLTEYARLKALIFAWYDGSVPADNGDVVFGENVHHAPQNNEPINATDVIESWYFEEEARWNYKSPQITPDTKEFAQIAWNSTRRFGCGQAVSKGKIGGTYTVCYYDPPMQYGAEAQNVFPADYEDESTGQSSTTPSTATGEAPASAEATTDASVGGGSPTRFIKSLIAQNRAFSPSPLADFKDVPL